MSKEALRPFSLSLIDVLTFIFFEHEAPSDRNERFGSNIKIALKSFKRNEIRITTYETLKNKMFKKKVDDKLC